MDDDMPSGHGIYLNDGNIRYSNSPRRWAKLQQSLHSPTKSVHPELEAMNPRYESIHQQPDRGLRTADFFDDSSIGSEDEGRSSPERKSRMPPSGQSAVSQCAPRESTMPRASSLYEDNDQRIPDLEARTEQQSRITSGSFAGSVDEFLPGSADDHGRSQSDTPRSARPPRSHQDESYHGSANGSVFGASKMPHPSRPVRPARPSSSQIPSSAGGHDRQEYPRPPIYNDARTSMNSHKVEQVLGVHAIAHDYLLRGLMNDSRLIGTNVQHLNGVRASLLPSALRTHDPRSPRFLIPEDSAIEGSLSEHTGSSKKRVYIVPPPIDTDRHHLPEDMIRTPYPFPVSNSHRKDFGQGVPSATDSPLGSFESMLTLSIRRSNPNSRHRVTTLTIPASHNFSAVRRNEKGESVNRVNPAPFDDQEIFHQLHKSYNTLCGPFRFFSARSLSRIVVTRPTSLTRGSGEGWLQQPRIPRVRAHQGLADTYSEEEILEHFRRPARGKGRYAFVHWAHQLTAAPPSTLKSPPLTGVSAEPQQESPSSFELMRKSEQPEGLEFVVGWSWRRILAAILIVLMLSVDAALLWIFLGMSSSLPWASAGFRGAGDRVGAGVLIGIMVLLVGLTGVTGWLGVSWLVM